MAAKRLIEIGSLLSRSPGHVGVEAPMFKYAAVLLLLQDARYLALPRGHREAQQAPHVGFEADERQGLFTIGPSTLGLPNARFRWGSSSTSQSKFSVSR